MVQSGAVQEASRWLLQHGYIVLLAGVAVEQLGVPVPAAPLLLAMGALAGFGRFSFPVALALASLAALAADLVWFRLGRGRGDSVLSVLCRLSLQPDSCVRTTHNAFNRYGQASLLFCKFIPGLSTVAPPLVGSSGMATWRFLALDLTGSVLWAGSFLAAGWVFRREAEELLTVLARLGLWFFVVVFVLLTLWLMWKYLQRRAWLEHVAALRISADELRSMLAGTAPPTVVDLRPGRAVLRTGLKIAGAFVLEIDELESHLRNFAGASHLVFYCNCPNEASSASLALKFHDAGFPNTSALVGGFEGWVAAGYPVEPVAT
jgi:membrane protein DedA with SNARE-associated domain/rhodanese-related sulfurtransferase